MTRRAKSEEKLKLLASLNKTRIDAALAADSDVGASAGEAVPSTERKRAARPWAGGTQSLPCRYHDGHEYPSELLDHTGRKRI